MISIDKNTLDPNKKFWLNDAKNLVTNLAKIYGKITLDKIFQDFSNITTLEKDLLNTETAIVRKISLSSIDKKLVFARTVIPKNTYEFFTKELDNLGTKPIGDNLLFDKEKFDRENFIIRSLTPEQFYAEAEIESESNVYSRSSIFNYRSSPDIQFLITEYFLILPEQHNDR